MKKRLLSSISSLLVVLFCFAGMAQAVEHTSGRITLDVPDGWLFVEQAETDNNAVAVVTKDMSAQINVIINPAGGLGTEAAAAALTKEFNGSKPKYEKESDAYIFNFTAEEGKETRVLVQIQGDTVIMLMLTGDHPQMIEIINSVKIRK